MSQGTRTTPQVKEEPTKERAVSGGQTQDEIDAEMKKIVNEFQHVFEGMGRAKVDPIDIKMKPGAIPVTQGRQEIPIQYRKPLEKKIQDLLKYDLIEGPLPANRVKGWVHNPVITDKKWSKEEIRLNIETKLMNEWVEPTKYPIPTPVELWHKFLGSDRFTTLDARDAFYMFLLTKKSQELFKFNTHLGVFMFKVLVMGTPPASAECHAAISKMLVGLKGVVQIKDDIVVHRKGKEHDKNLKKVLQMLDEYGLRFRKEKCRFGQPEVLWFGHIFTKQGMSPDPEKVAHIKQWPVPLDKSEVKSFLQTVQFCAPYMFKQGDRTHGDVTAPLRELTKQDTHFKWTRECQKSFDELKTRLTEKTVLVNYDPERDTRLYVDHGPMGIASTVAQRYKENGQDIWKAVYHNGRRLEPAEQ